jgi:hypothetical protein
MTNKKEFPEYKAPSKDRLIAGGEGSPDAEAFRLMMSAPSPVVEYVRWAISLPVRDPAELFGDNIDFLQNVRTVAGVDSVDSSFVLNGILQVDMLAVGYEVLLDGDPVGFSCTDARGQLLEWGKPTWDAVRALARGYLLQITVMQRYMLANDPLIDVARVGSRREPIQKSDGWPQPYIDRVNAKMELCGSCGSARAFGPSATNVVEMVADSRYLDSGAPELTRFPRPVLIRKGMLLKANLILNDGQLQSELRRAVANELGVFKGGAITIEFRLRGYEVWGPWNAFFVKNANGLGVATIGQQRNQ